jgi:hypothetical protein
MLMIPKLPLNEIPLFQASKWLKLPLLLSVAEMKGLLAFLPEWIVPLSGVIEEGKEIISRDTFLSLYADYVAQIDAGIKRPTIDKHLTCAFTDDLNNLRAATVPGGLLIRIVRPVLQVQPYMIHYSATSEKFIDTTHSQNSFAWGLAFSTPQLFQNPYTKDIEKIADPAYKSLQKWSRANTIPTPFLVDGKLINFPSRIGKTRETPICIPQK